MEKVIVNARDGYKLNVTVFAVDAPKGYIQVIHGMEEHQERYEPLASYLNSPALFSPTYTDCSAYIHFE